MSEVNIREKLQAILNEATEKIQAADALEKLNEVRVNFLGKKGQLTAVLKGMKDVAPEDRPKVGQLVNEAREKIESLMDESKSQMEKMLLEKKLADSSSGRVSVKQAGQRFFPFPVD